MNADQILHDARNSLSEECAPLFDRLCDGHPEMRKRVQTRLDETIDADRSRGPSALDDTRESALGDLDSTRDGASSTRDGASSSRADTWPDLSGRASLPTIPNYQITGVIARGGMGCVYAAVDLTLDREVAIKTLLPGAPADRFMTESKITARLPHPNVPPVHAIGRLDDGTPFLTMKLVRGRTLAALLQERLSPAADLPRFVQIFEQIAQAVGFAHAQGIVHRDLKPLNVMVGAFGEVQVMDWGLAKDVSVRREAEPVSSAAETDDLALTSAGAILGTPGYMAPEQARGEQVDARADVFSLGALLAAVLTGKPAFLGTTVHETIAKSAQGDLGEVLGRLDASSADADLIALAKHCLAAVAADRPADAYAVAQAVAAYRAGVEARLLKAETDAAAAGVREAEQRKRRHVLLASAVAITFTLSVGLGVSLWQRNVAVKRLAQLEKGNEILAAVFNDFDTREAKQGDEPLEAVLAKRLVKAAEQLEGEAVGDALTVSKLQYRLGVSLLSLGHAPAALPLIEKAQAVRKAKLGVDDPDTLAATTKLAQSYYALGTLDQAVPMLQECLHRYQARMGRDHPDTLAAMSNLAQAYVAMGKRDLALPLQEECLRLQKAKLGPDHPDLVSEMNNLAINYFTAGRHRDALPLQEECLRLQKTKLPPEHPDLLSAINNLAASYHAVGKLTMALPLWEEYFRLSKVKRGADHPDTLKAMGNLAQGYAAAGNVARAIPLQEECLRRQKTKQGSDHPDTLLAANNLAASYYATGKRDQALAMQEECLRVRTAQLGSDHPDTLRSMNNLAATYYAVGKLTMALPLWEEYFRLSKAKQGSDHPSTLNAMNNLAQGYVAAGKREQALRLQEECLRLQKAKRGPDHPDTLKAMGNLAGGYAAAGKRDQALAMQEECLRRRKATLGPDHPDTLLSMNNLASSHFAANKLDQAIPLYEGAAKELAKRGFEHEQAGLIMSNTATALEAANDLDAAERWRRQWAAVVKERSGAASVAYAGELASLGDNLLRQRKYVDAEGVLRECFAIRDKTQPKVWSTFNTQSTLGAALLGQKKYADAEPLLLRGYEEMKQRETTIPPKAKNQRLGQAVDRLIELYNVTNRADEIKKWQAERVKFAPQPPAKQEGKKKPQAAATAG